MAEKTSTNKESTFLDQIVRVTSTKKEKQKLTSENLQKTIDIFAGITKISDKNVAGATLLIGLQLGGVASRKGNKFTAEIDGIKIDQEDIVTAIHGGCTKDTTARGFARNFANEIFQVSKLNKIPGNITKKLTTNYPEQWGKITETNKEFWASDFQGQNEDCPTEIRALINLQYQAQFTASSRPSQKKN